LGARREFNSMTGMRFANTQYFNPRHLPNLTLWHDASDPNANSVLPADGTAMSTWADKSGKSHGSSQGTGASQPLFKLNIVNGLPGVLFDGSNDFMNMQLASTFGISNSPYEIFVVAKSSSSAIQFLTSCATAGKYEIDLNAAVGCSFIPTSGGTDIGTTNQYTDGNPHIFSGRVQSDGSQTSYVRVNRTDGGSPLTSGQSTTTAALRMGYRGNSTFPLAGYIFEIVICNTQLTTDQRTSLETYFKRWGA
jgi:hypothetical protein